jgi:maltoporin
MPMPFLPLSFHAPPTISSFRTKARVLLLGAVAGAACLSVGTLSAQTSAEVADLQKRLAEMEAKLKSMEAQVALAGSIAKSRTLTGPDGKEISMKEGPVIVPALDTFTRNLKFHTYFRAGTGFTANGVGQTFAFNTPDVSFGKTQRLGNENDFYIETGPIWDHMLGDDPDAIDVKAKMTFTISDGVDKQVGTDLTNDGFNIGMVECYVEMKNVIKSAPEITFWGGQRFYDRYDIHPSDYFFLNTSGIGAGAYNIPLGPGLLQIAYFGGTRSGTGTFFLDDTSFNDVDLAVNGGTGEFYRHVLDLRWGDVPFLGGKLKLVLIGSYQHGGDFTIDAQQDRTDSVTDPNVDGQGHVENSGGIGGGFVHQWDLPPSWGKLSYVQLAALYGWGLVDFDPSGVNLDKLVRSYNSAVNSDNSPAGTFEDINPYNNSQRARANVFWVWNPTDNFSLGTWASYQFDDQGFTSYRVSNGDISSASRYSHLVSAGIRPYYWLWGPFAIQGAAAFAYISNNRDITSPTIGEGGALGIFTIAPTIKPRGGFFTRPEIRAYATFAVWSDELQGAIGGTPYANKNYGFVFGVQAETWF